MQLLKTKSIFLCQYEKNLKSCFVTLTDWMYTYSGNTEQVLLIVDMMMASVQNDIWEEEWFVGYE